MLQFNGVRMVVTKVLFNGGGMVMLERWSVLKKGEWIMLQRWPL